MLVYGVETTSCFERQGGDEDIVPWDGEACGAKLGLVVRGLSPDFLIVPKIGKNAAPGLEALALFWPGSAKKLHFHGTAEGGFVDVEQSPHRQFDI